jgi:hypothetical protein
MSDFQAFYGDFGVSEASAIRNRKRQSIANLQSATLGQKRGARRISDIQKQYQEGFSPMVASYGKRGFGGPNVTSGIRTTGLEKYAKNLQQDLGAESANLQDELNNIAMNDAQQQSDLDQYLQELRLSKQQQILGSATDIKQFASY